MLTCLFVWLAIGLAQAPFHYAALLAYWQRNWPQNAQLGYRSDVTTSISMALTSIFLGGLAIPMVMWATCNFKHGLKWK